MVVANTFYGKKTPIVGTYDIIDDDGRMVGHATVLNQNKELKVISSDNISKRSKEELLGFVRGCLRN